MILAVDTLKVAAGKEDIADSVRAADYGLLTFMHGD
jgi:hypothetical protein